MTDQIKAIVLAAGRGSRLEELMMTVQKRS